MLSEGKVNEWSTYMDNNGVLLELVKWIRFNEKKQRGRGYG